MALVIASITGVSINPPSVEQYTADTAVVIGYTGRNLVFWTKAGSVYHLCDAALGSATGIEGQHDLLRHRADAHAAGKSG